MKLVEVITNQSRTSKLTVTPTRVTMSLQETMADTERKVIIEFFLLIAEYLRNETYSVRGTLFRDGSIFMQRNCGTVVQKFDMK